MFKNCLRTITPLGAIAPKIDRGSPSKPAAALTRWPLSFTRVKPLGVEGSATLDCNPIFPWTFPVFPSDILKRGNITVRLPQRPEPVPLDRLTLARGRVKMPELYERVPHR